MGPREISWGAAPHDVYKSLTFASICGHTPPAGGKKRVRCLLRNPTFRLAPPLAASLVAETTSSRRPWQWLRSAGQSGPRVSANVGCPDPDNPSGQWNWLHSVKDLDGLDLRENAVCWCNKRGCRAYIKKAKEEEREKLKEAMFRGSANDPCLPNAYQVKLIRDLGSEVHRRPQCGRVGLPRPLLTTTYTLRQVRQPRQDEPEEEGRRARHVPL